MAFVFRLQTLRLKDFSIIYGLNGLKLKNKDQANFYECCDLTKKVYLTYVCIMCSTVYTSFIIDPLYAKYMCALHICTHPLYFMYSLLQHRIRIFRKLLHMFSDVQKLTKRITSFLSPQSHHDQNDLSK